MHNFKVGGRYIVRKMGFTPLFEVECLEISPNFEFVKLTEFGWERIDSYKIMDCLPPKSLPEQKQ